MIYQDPRGIDRFNIQTNGFKGLFNATDIHLIPEGCLYDMKNLHINDFGILRSMYKPKIVTGSPFGTGAVTSVGYRANLYVGTEGGLYHDGAVIPNCASANGYKIVRHIGTEFTVDTVNGLIILPTGTQLTAAMSGKYPTPPDSYLSHDICNYEGRLWFNMNAFLRGSDMGEALNDEAWIGPTDPVLGTLTHANEIFGADFDTSIRALAELHTSMLIFTDDGIYQLPYFFGGKIQKVYSGPDRVGWLSLRQFTFSDGQAVYFAGDDGLFMYGGGGSPDRLSGNLKFTHPIGAFYVGQYDNRMWFLVSDNVAPVGEEKNYIYALNLKTGYWEKYDIDMGSTGAGFTYDTPTAISGDPSSLQYTDNLYIGMSSGNVYCFNEYEAEHSDDTLPWAFTTQAVTPTMDIPLRPIHVKLDYVEQSVDSPFTIHFIVDGVELADTEATTVSGNMYHAGTLRRMWKEFDVPVQAFANSIAIRVEGTGPCEIMGWDLEYQLIRHGGDNNFRT